MQNQNISYNLEAPKPQSGHGLAGAKKRKYYPSETDNAVHIQCLSCQLGRYGNVSYFLKVGESAPFNSGDKIDKNCPGCSHKSLVKS